MPEIENFIWIIYLLEDVRMEVVNGEIITLEAKKIKININLRKKKT